MAADRPPLTRSRVARAAVAFIDTHGLAELSMRKLGAELGVEAMSLYNHVASKDDLCAAVAEEIYAEILADCTSPPEATWQEDGRLVAMAYRDAAFRHPNALPLFSGKPLMGPNGMVFLDRCFRVFTKAGLDVKEATLAFLTSAAWLVGLIEQELGLMRTMQAHAGPTATATSPGELPAELVGLLQFQEASLVSTAEDRFAYGLEVLIAGIAVRLGLR